MPDDLDPTTARLVSELASSILPSLTRSLSASIPTAEFLGALERTNRAGNELRAQIEKSIRSSIDDSRAGRSLMMQSVETLSNEILNLKKAVSAIPERLERKIQIQSEQKENVKKENVNLNYDEMFAGTNEKLKEITDLLNELIKGLQQFSETYAQSSRKFESVNVNVNPNQDISDSVQNNGMSDKLERLINDSLPSLEGLVKAQSKSQTKELRELSRELSALHEQNNAALIQEVRTAVEEEVKKHAAGDKKNGKDTDTKKLLMINMCLSGACAFMSLIMFLILMFR